MVDVDAEYELYPAEHRGMKRSEVTEDGLDALKTYTSAIQPKYLLETVLAATGYKQGALVTATFPDDASINGFVRTLAAMGVTCAVDRQEPELGKAKTCIFMTRDLSYGRDDFEEISRLKKEDVDAYHRAMGAFLGYPEAAIDAFVDHGRTPAAELEAAGYRTGMTKRGSQEGVMWTQETKNSVFNSYAPAADTDALDGYEDRAGTRFQAVQAIEEAYDVVLQDIVEARAEALCGTPWGENR